MRIPALAMLVVFAAASVSASSVLSPSPGFGASGAAAFQEYTVEGVNGAPEPTIGIPWNTDHVFYHSGSTTVRGTFADDDSVVWEDVTPLYQVPINLDPMLVADEGTGRVFAGGLHGACSVMMYSDDDGATWLPAGNMCSGADFDHQSIGIGPAASNPLGGILYPHQAYYCGQSGTISCATSVDGGVTWAPFVQEQTVCAGFHGHIRVSYVTGMMAVPVADCGGDLGLLATLDGITYTAKTIPDTEEWTNGFDPSLQFGRQEGWLWYGMASEHGIHISLSKDDGATWEPLGDDGSASLDVGALFDPPVVAGTFADVQVGDDDRVAFSFIGLETSGNATTDQAFLNTNQIFQCDDRQDELVWNYYLAMTYDAGATWDVQKISKDPVQVGGVYDSVVESESGACRNLLDFNDMDIDSTGRVHIGWADGCVGACAATAAPGGDGYRAQEPRLSRQVAGKGLFAAFDLPDTTDTDGDGTPDASDDDIDGDGVPNAEDDDPAVPVVETPKKKTPGFTAVPLVAGLGALVALGRRR